jgi:hypothetical protein
VLVPSSASLLSAHFHTQDASVAKVFLVVMITVIAPLSIGLFIQRIRPTQATGLSHDPTKTPFRQTGPGRRPESPAGCHAQHAGLLCCR